MNKIGVVVCNFNGEKYIIGCLDAVFNSDIIAFWVEFSKIKDSPNNKRFLEHYE